MFGDLNKIVCDPVLGKTDLNPFKRIHFNSICFIGMSKDNIATMSSNNIIKSVLLPLSLPVVRIASQMVHNTPATTDGQS